MSKKVKKILIVEDETSSLKALVDKFNREGFKTIEAQDGEIGLKKALKEHPDLILLDIILPKMDGLTALKKLREDKWGKDALVILLTNLSDSKKVAEAVEHNACEYLVKSDWTIEDVVKRVKDKLAV